MVIPGYPHPNVQMNALERYIVPDPALTMLTRLMAAFMPSPLSFLTYPAADHACDPNRGRTSVPAREVEHGWFCALDQGQKRLFGNPGINRRDHDLEDARDLAHSLLPNMLLQERDPTRPPRCDPAREHDLPTTSPKLADIFTAIL